LSRPHIIREPLRYPPALFPSGFLITCCDLQHRSSSLFDRLLVSTPLRAREIAVTASGAALTSLSPRKGLQLNQAGTPLGIVVPTWTGPAPLFTSIIPTVLGLPSCFQTSFPFPSAFDPRTTT
jgi:hypothetical protein